MSVKYHQSIKIQEEGFMSDTTKSPNEKTSQLGSARVPQIQIQSGLRAGGASGPCDTAYWRQQLNYWRNLANQMGCA
jgi:hypothetical protein